MKVIDITWLTNPVKPTKRPMLPTVDQIYRVLADASLNDPWSVASHPDRNMLVQIGLSEDFVHFLTQGSVPGSHWTGPELELYTKARRLWYMERDAIRKGLAFNISYAPDVHLTQGSVTGSYWTGIPPSSTQL